MNWKEGLCSFSQRGEIASTLSTGVHESRFITGNWFRVETASAAIWPPIDFWEGIGAITVHISSVILLR